jgi:hypothetical protein
MPEGRGKQGFELEVVIEIGETGSDGSSTVHRNTRFVTAG